MPKAIIRLKASYTRIAPTSLENLAIHYERRKEVVCYYVIDLEPLKINDNHIKKYIQESGKCNASQYKSEVVGSIVFPCPDTNKDHSQHKTNHAGTQVNKKFH